MFEKHISSINTILIHIFLFFKYDIILIKHIIYKYIQINIDII